MKIGTKWQACWRVEFASIHVEADHLLSWVPPLSVSLLCTFSAYALGILAKPPPSFREPLLHARPVLSWTLPLQRLFVAYNICLRPMYSRGPSRFIAETSRNRLGIPKRSSTWLRVRRRSSLSDFMAASQFIRSQPSNGRAVRGNPFSSFQFSSVIFITEILIKPFQ